MVTRQLGSFSWQMWSFTVSLYSQCYCLLVWLCEVSDYNAADSKLVSPSSINLAIKNPEPVYSQLQ